MGKRVESRVRFHCLFEGFKTNQSAFVCVRRIMDNRLFCCGEILFFNLFDECETKDRFDLLILSLN